MIDHHERRCFRRIAFKARTELVQGEQLWTVKLLDLSLKGLLIECPKPWDADPTAVFNARVHLDDHTVIKMEVELRHEEPGHQVGFACLYIDIDSITHLRRLIELNLGDDDELHRELRQLIEI
ncbi:PilZ domain-containing protein [Pseudomonas fontis]|uniref:Cyclic diguanosine monophosphate-binding protein n=1 Tax=Pseudomonas fontis TaxID=2942633 RepID=A0ABT5NTP9_9PSED|nr:PilZ domain-containing protein [Pseudomonas fontis]MDD0976100.1 PilZ domain-containing protein [Pseudomonas fontis]MDD0991550.1 PilZ domain-containing protein [Pseudomonas fontis]